MAVGIEKLIWRTGKRNIREPVIELHLESREVFPKNQ